MAYRCPRCGFEWVENVGGTLEDAMAKWPEYVMGVGHV
jgi:transposase-like protein